MNLVMNEQSLSSRWRDAFRVRAPATDCHQTSPRSTNGEMTGKRLCRGWFAQRTWEDDGGRVGQELTRAAG